MKRTAALPVYLEDLTYTTERYDETLDPASTHSIRLADSAVVDRHIGLERTVGRMPEGQQERFFSAPELRSVALGKKTSFSVEKEWEGAVENIGISHFTARLSETRRQDSELELAEIPIGDVPREHRDDLREGAVFRYLLGYAQDERGTVTKKRLVYFRKGRLRRDEKLEQEWLMMASLFTHDPFTK